MDGKSTVSTFYGGRKNDAAKSRIEDASSFFQPDRAPQRSADLVNQPASAGYNRMSFLHTGREEPLKGGYDEEEGQTWDVFADFNNAGPRYSSTLVQNTQGYQQLDNQSSPQKLDPSPPAVPGHHGPVEMVTVPALGPEWQKSELEDMTKASKRQKKHAARKDFWKKWNRDQTGVCGGWLTRRLLVWGLFGLCIAAGIILAFTIPRIPSFATIPTSPLLIATGHFAASIPILFSRAPANFSFPVSANLQLNTQSSYLPITFKHLNARVTDLQTNFLVGTGSIAKATVPAKAFPRMQIPLNFTYVATNDTDQTWLNWYNGCKNTALFVNGTRPPVSFILTLNTVIVGLPGTHSASVQVDDAACPFQLPLNSV